MQDQVIEPCNHMVSYLLRFPLANDFREAEHQTQRACWETGALRSEKDLSWLEVGGQDRRHPPQLASAPH